MVIVQIPLIGQAESNLRGWVPIASAMLAIAYLTHAS